MKMNLLDGSKAPDLQEFVYGSDGLITTTLLPVPLKHPRFLLSTEQRQAIP